MTDTLTPVPRVHIENRRTSGRLAVLAEDHREALRGVEYTRERLQAAVMKALEAGEPISAVARQSGYTRQRLHQLRAEVVGK